MGNWSWRDLPFRHCASTLADAVREAAGGAPLQGHGRLLQEDRCRGGSRGGLVQGFHGKCLAQCRWSSRSCLLRQGQDIPGALILLQGGSLLHVEIHLLAVDTSCA